MHTTATGPARSLKSGQGPSRLLRPGEGKEVRLSAKASEAAVFFPSAGRGGGRALPARAATCPSVGASPTLSHTRRRRRRTQCRHSGAFFIVLLFVLSTRGPGPEVAPLAGQPSPAPTPLLKRPIASRGDLCARMQRMQRDGPQKRRRPRHSHGQCRRYVSGSGRRRSASCVHPGSGLRRTASAAEQCLGRAKEAKTLRPRQTE